VTIHIIGAGLSGLSAALVLARWGCGADIVLHEAAAHAGGRCRSWHDARLDAVIDNGTHVVVGANREVRAYLEALRVSDRLHWFDAGMSFLDLRDDARWTLSRPGDLLRLARAGHGSAIGEMLTTLRLVAPFGTDTVAARIAEGSRLGPLLWDPLAHAVMNCPPDRAAAAPFARVLRRTLARGAGAMRVAAVRTSLGDCFIDPALEALRHAGVRLRFGARLQASATGSDAIRTLSFADSQVTLAAADRVILALPPWELARVIPALAIDCASAPIVNLHVRLPKPLGDGAPLLRGLIGGSAQWVLARGAILSATVSAADALVEQDPEALARLLWRDVARACDLAGELPDCWRVVKERRATPLQDPAFESRRPGVATRFTNLLLAGDWVEPGLPCTIESAIASGSRAAIRLLASLPVQGPAAR